MFLNVHDVVSLSECNHYLHAVCNSRVVWQQLFRDYFVEPLRDLESETAVAPPFLQLTPVTEPPNRQDADCSWCHQQLVVEEEEAAAQPLWRLHCEHICHHRCLLEMKEKLANPHCDVCDHPLDTGSCDEESYEQVFSKRLIEQRMKVRWCL
jgi:hypothetical protein